MATAPPPTSRPPLSRRVARAPTPRWSRWLLLGLFFGLGYGLTQRLMETRWGEGSTGVPVFRPTSPPGGTSLEELRRQKGEPARPLAADLQELGEKQREEKEKLEAARREGAERQDAALEEERQRMENDRRRLESLNAPPDPLQPLASPPAMPQIPPPELSSPPAPQSPGTAPPPLP